VIGITGAAAEAGATADTGAATEGGGASEAVLAGGTETGDATDAGGEDGTFTAGSGVAVELVGGLAFSDACATALSELGGAGAGGGVEAALGMLDAGGGVLDTRSASSFNDGRLRMLCGPDADRWDMGGLEALGLSLLLLSDMLVAPTMTGAAKEE
jgi:hypothetical protein